MDQLSKNCTLKTDGNHCKLQRNRHGLNLSVERHR